MAEKNAATLVFIVDLHCAGCAQKVRKCLNHLTSVKSVKTDRKTNRVMVTGNVDPAFIKQILEENTKKKVDFVTPAKPEGESEKKKPEEKKSKEATTVVLKTDVHCEGCATKMTKIIGKYKGVQTVNVDLSKDQIVVKGTMDMKQMLPYLNAKLKKKLEVVPPPEEKKPAAGGGGNGGKVESVNKMEYNGYPYGGGLFYSHQAAPVPENGYWMGYGNAPPPYLHAPPPPMPSYLHAPQMFSDENPNACSIM